MASSPRLPLPAPLRGAEKGTFAHRTVTVRLPQIGRRILVENKFSAQVVSQLQALLDELPYGVVRDLQDREAPDWAAWQRYLFPYRGMNWLEVPWFFAETNFYRRVLEATGYFQPGEGFERDPYKFQKRQGLESFTEAIRNACGLVDAWLSGIKSSAREISAERLGELFLMNLWGNQADLSMWPAGQPGRPDHQGSTSQLSHLLCNHAVQAAEYLLRLREDTRRVDMILDNAGLELVHDLLLADALLGIGLAQEVRLHVKAHPTFVSDAIRRDILDTVEYLSRAGEVEMQVVARRLRAALRAKRLSISEDFFWTSPLSMWEMPDELRQELGEAVLLISKGDANYRRLVGDRHWQFDTPLPDVLNYLPTSLLALRVSKSQVMIGLPPGKAEQMDALDPQWMTNGRWGVIQFYRSIPLTASQP